MDYLKLICLFCLTCGSFGQDKPKGACYTKLVKGKFVQIGDCEKNDGSEMARLMKESLAMKENQKGNCDVTYNSKCFKSIVYQERNVSYTDMVPICKEINGKPANIYDVKHYRMFEKNFREKIKILGRKWIEVWTGMTYQDNQLKLRSGESNSLPAEYWYFHYPESGFPDRKYVQFIVRKNPKGFQGMWNPVLKWNNIGVLCEKDL